MIILIKLTLSPIFIYISLPTLNTQFSNRVTKWQTGVPDQNFVINKPLLPMKSLLLVFFWYNYLRHYDLHNNIIYSQALHKRNLMEFILLGKKEICLLTDARKSQRGALSL